MGILLPANDPTRIIPVDVAANALAPWLFRCYTGLRRHVAGIDQLALGAAFFLVALAIRLLKVGALKRCRRLRRAG